MTKFLKSKKSILIFFIFSLLILLGAIYYFYFMNNKIVTTDPNNSLKVVENASVPIDDVQEEELDTPNIQDHKSDENFNLLENKDEIFKLLKKSFNNRFLNEKLRQFVYDSLKSYNITFSDDLLDKSIFSSTDKVVVSTILIDEKLNKISDLEFDLELTYRIGRSPVSPELSTQRIGSELQKLLKAKDNTSNKKIVFKIIIDKDFKKAGIEHGK